MLVLDHLATSFNDTRVYDHLGVYEHQWADDITEQGAYSSYYPPGVISSFSRTLHERLDDPEQGLFVAGADYASLSPGYIDGAIRSGAEAAQKIIDMSGFAEER